MLLGKAHIHRNLVNVFCLPAMLWPYRQHSMTKNYMNNLGCIQKMNNAAYDSVTVELNGKQIQLKCGVSSQFSLNLISSKTLVLWYLNIFLINTKVLSLCCKRYLQNTNIA